MSDYQSPLLPPKDDAAANQAVVTAKLVASQLRSELFGPLGIDIANMSDMKALRDDLEFLRRLRTTSNKVGLAAVTAIAGAIGIGVWEFIKRLAHWH